MFIFAVTLPSFAQNFPKPVSSQRPETSAEQCEGAKRLRHCDSTSERQFALDTDQQWL
jgi:hypothetical protein